jgi:hypothetical protein
MSLYLPFPSCPVAFVLVITLLFLIPKKQSSEDVFKRACENGSERNKDVVNGEEIKKNLQPNTEDNCKRSLRLWY